MRFVTEYLDKADGAGYDGPQIEADTLAAAVAITACCIFGPRGERLTVLGELVPSFDTEALLEQLVHPDRPTKES